MLTVALDTSTRRGSVALGEVDLEAGSFELLGEADTEVSATHSEAVLPALDRLVRTAGRRAAPIEAVAVGAGPGSFTGVRIGAALARGLCFSGRSTLFAYSSLASIAAAAGVEGKLCALSDARRDQVYAAGYDVSARGVGRRFGPRAGALGELLDELDGGDWTFAGVLSGAQRAMIEGTSSRLLPPDVGRPSAAGLLRLVATAPEGGRVETPADWEPEYVRVSSARRREEG